MMNRLATTLPVVLLVALTNAFSAPSVSVRPPSSFGPAFPAAEGDGARFNDKVQPDDGAKEQQVITSVPWRLVLDIGREPLGGGSMPFSWARSGCRMPLVIPCDFRSDQKVLPQSDTVSVTGPGGAVVKPIEGGSWQLTNDSKELSLDLTFPEYLERRDVWIDAGSTLSLQGTVYTQQEMNRLNGDFYQARDKTWKLGAELNDIARRKDGPKKWNEEKQVWEKRLDGVPSVLEQMQKRVQLMAAEAAKKQCANQRPKPSELSGLGFLPVQSRDSSSSEPLYVQKEGAIKFNNAVIGRWSAEPITNQPASYYN